MTESATKNLSGKVDASPTKRFFIAVLIKDIQFLDAVVELVDNSVDAAKAESPSGDLLGHQITIEYSSDTFLITDNAGGISIAQAKNFAFRFGRADDAPQTPGSVGEFGVGMKRALFKIGRNFSVSSTTTTERFLVEVDVDVWEAENNEPGEWTFPMTVEERNVNSAPTGTSIKVTKMYPYATDELSSLNFGTRLSALLRQAHAPALAAGLQIVVGATSLHAQVSTLLQSTELIPISFSQTLDIDGKEVKVTIIAGLGERTLSEAGWYIYCNGRLIERAEQTERTGWQTAIIEGEKKAPKAHWQFARFRGYVLFESKDTDVLPWNTTKTGLDIEAPAYRRIRVDMSVAMREVITFLNSLDAEGADGPISAAIRSAAAVPLVNIHGGRNFVFHQPSASPSVPKPVKISVDCEPTLFEELKSHMGATNRRSIGEELLRYYVDGEGLDG